MELSTSLHYPSSPLLFRPSKRRSTTRVSAGSRKREDAGDYSWGRAVDMNMIVLRKRIRDMEMAERNYEPLSDWCHWEKQHFGNYESLVYQLVATLQWQLMNSRPSVALGVIAFVALSVPISTAMAFSHFIDLLSNFS